MNRIHDHKPKEESKKSANNACKQNPLLHIAPIMGLTINPEWQHTVTAHLDNAQKMANIIYQAPIDNNTLDLANSYHLPGKPSP